MVPIFSLYMYVSSTTPEILPTNHTFGNLSRVPFLSLNCTLTYETSVIYNICKHPNCRRADYSFMALGSIPGAAVCSRTSFVFTCMGS